MFREPTGGGRGIEIEGFELAEGGGGGHLVACPIVRDAIR